MLFQYSHRNMSVNNFRTAGKIKPSDGVLTTLSVSLMRVADQDKDPSSLDVLLIYLIKFMHCNFAFVSMKKAKNNDSFHGIVYHFGELEMYLLRLRKPLCKRYE